MKILWFIAGHSTLYMGMQYCSAVQYLPLHSKNMERQHPECSVDRNNSCTVVSESTYVSDLKRSDQTIAP